MAQGDLLWAYGVVGASWSPPEPIPGIGDRPVELVRHDDLAVVAGAVPRDSFSSEALRRRLEDLDTLAELARAHDRVLSAVLSATDVLPFRICTIYESRSAIEGLLRSDGGHFRSVLERLHDMTEWGVKAFLVGAADQRPDPAPSSGTEYLARRRAERDRAGDHSEAAEAAAAAVHQALSEQVAASTLAPPQDRRISGRAAEMVLNGAYLVPRANAATFAALVDEQNRRHAADRLELVVTGPWPPYNFVPDLA